MKRSVLFRPLLMLAVLLLAILACMPGPAPTSAPAYDPTKAALEQMATAASVQLTQVSQQGQQPQQPEQPQQPTQAPAAATTAAPAAGQQFFTENFDTDTGQWSHFVIDASAAGSLGTLVNGNTDNMSAQVQDGHMAFDIKAQEQWAYAIYDGAEYTDVKMEAVADNRGTNDNAISLICRYSKENGWYEFNVANNGLYNILFAKQTPDNKVVYSLIADGGSNKIKQGKQTNTYSISCKGRTLVLSINGFETRRLDDNDHALDQGKIGLSVSSFRTTPVTVLFDTVTISQP